MNYGIGQVNHPVGNYADDCVQKLEYETRTVESNIDMKIANCKAEIARLEQSKIDLAPLLKMRIRDIQQAMQF